jgi:phosphatidate cytidylyltransferase
MLKQRVVTALALMAILLPALFWFPPIAWGMVSLGFLAMAAFEWARLLNPQGQAWGVAAAVAALGLLYLFSANLNLAHRHLALTVSLLLTLFWMFEGAYRLRSGLARRGGRATAALLLLGCWYAMYELRLISVFALLSSMAIVWIADIAAYFVGRAFGKRKLAPTISPGKSWEGAIGGGFFVVVLGLMLAALPGAAGSLPERLVSQWSPLIAIPVLIGLVSLSVVGDLHESLLKRLAGVKDSGRTLPGHGGVLDRIDALIPVMPACLLIYILTQT